MRSLFGRERRGICSSASARIRRGDLDATLILQDNSRFFSARKGPLVINAVRFATSFFGKGQFIPASTERNNGAYVSAQSLDAPYYQPLNPTQPVNYRNWAELREQRPKTQLCRLQQSATVVERPGGFDFRVQAQGTPGVPLAIEINLREGGFKQRGPPSPTKKGRCCQRP